MNKPNILLGPGVSVLLLAWTAGSFDVICYSSFMAFPLSMIGDVMQHSPKQHSDEQNSVPQRVQVKQRHSSSEGLAGSIKFERLTRTDIVYVISLTIASLITYLIIYYVLEPFTNHSNDSLGALVATATTVFIFKEGKGTSLPAATTQFFATIISCVLTLVYLLLLPSSPIGMAVLVGIGTLIVMLVGQRGGVIAAGVATIVIMVNAGIDSANQVWMIPPLRLLDTLIGLVVGLGCRWIVQLLVNWVKHAKFLR